MHQSTIFCRIRKSRNAKELTNLRKHNKIKSCVYSHGFILFRRNEEDNERNHFDKLIF